MLSNQHFLSRWTYMGQWSEFMSQEVFCERKSNCNLRKSSTKKSILCCLIQKSIEQSSFQQQFLFICYQMFSQSNFLAFKFAINEMRWLYRLTSMISNITTATIVKITVWLSLIEFWFARHDRRYSIDYFSSILILHWYVNLLLIVLNYSSSLV